MNEVPALVTDRLRLTLPEAGAVDAVVDFYERNRTHLEPWNPALPFEFYTARFWRRQLVNNLRDLEDDRSCRFFLFDDDDRVVGAANLFHIVRGALQRAQLGYALDRALEGQGYMREALEAIIGYGFGPLGLHRIQADHLPHNHRSAGLLARLGFEREGYAKRFLLMADGEWHDHVRTALVRPD